MIIKRLRMHNIRSYVDEDVTFPDGAILFEGDVGSGKTTLLISIEFALFGTSSELKGEHLLRSGALRGSVELTMEVTGRQMTIKRVLERAGSTVSQAECSIVIDNAREDYSVSEMKTRVLSILGFNEKPHPKASSLIYRYAIFTPQERMKEILLSNADERLETIRRAFMMEDYKNVTLNSDEFQRSLKIGIKSAEATITELDEIRRGVEERTAERSSLDNEITALDKNIANERSILEKLNAGMTALQKLKERHAVVRTEINSLERAITREEMNESSLSQKMTYANKKIEQVESRIKALNDRKASFDKSARDVMPLLGIGSADENAISAKRKTLKEESEELSSQTERIKSRIQDMKKLAAESICPLCRQKINVTDFRNEMDSNSSKLSGMEDKKSRLAGMEANMELLLSAVQGAKEADSELTLHNSILKEELSRKKEFSHDAEKSAAIIAKSRAEKSAYEAEIMRSDEELKKMDGLEKEAKLCREKTEELSNMRSSKTQRVKDVASMIEKDTKRLAQMTSKSEEIKSAKECHDWLQSYFTPAVESIEKHVFAGYNMNFDALFRKWFSILMDSGDISVRIDDKFTPLVEQNGYEQDIDALSGGEKTSVALAYRLALNTLVKEISISLKNNLLILDEPTDGFSKEQLHRMRDVLDELKCNQVIIVSHEKELEAFVDNIIEVRKEGSVSRIIAK